MNAKPTSGPAQYFCDESDLRDEPEDLAPRNQAEDEVWLDAYLRRNMHAINASLAEDHAEFERGEYFTLEQVIEDIESQRQRRDARQP
jgi:hypothetical protein